MPSLGGSGAYGGDDPTGGASRDSGGDHEGEGGGYGWYEGPLYGPSGSIIGHTGDPGIDALVNEIYGALLPDDIKSAIEKVPSHVAKRKVERYFGKLSLKDALKGIKSGFGFGSKGMGLLSALAGIGSAGVTSLFGGGLGAFAGLVAGDYKSAKAAFLADGHTEEEWASAIDEWNQDQISGIFGGYDPGTGASINTRGGYSGVKGSGDYSGGDAGENPGSDDSAFRKWGAESGPSGVSDIIDAMRKKGLLPGDSGNNISQYPINPGGGNDDIGGNGGGDIPSSNSTSRYQSFMDELIAGAKDIMPDVGNWSERLPTGAPPQTQGFNDVFSSMLSALKGGNMDPRDAVYGPPVPTQTGPMASLPPELFRLLQGVGQPLPGSMPTPMPDMGEAPSGGIPIGWQGPPVEKATGGQVVGDVNMGYGGQAADVDMGFTPGQIPSGGSNPNYGDVGNWIPGMEPRQGNRQPTPMPDMGVGKDPFAGYDPGRDLGGIGMPPGVEGELRRRAGNQPSPMPDMEGVPRGSSPETPGFGIDREELPSPAPPGMAESGTRSPTNAVLFGSPTDVQRPRSIGADEIGQDLAPFIDAMQKAGGEYAGKSGQLWDKLMGMEDYYMGESSGIRNKYDQRMDNIPTVSLQLPGEMGGGTLVNPNRKWADQFTQQATTGQNLLGSQFGMQSGIMDALGQNALNKFGVDAQTAAPLAMPAEMAHDLRKIDQTGEWDLSRLAGQGINSLNQIDRQGGWDMEKLLNSIAGNVAGDISRQNNQGMWDLSKMDRSLLNELMRIDRTGEWDFAKLLQSIGGNTEGDLRKIAETGKWDLEKIKLMESLKKDPSLWESLLPAFGYIGGSGAFDGIGKAIGGGIGSIWNWLPDDGGGDWGGIWDDVSGWFDDWFSPGGGGGGDDFWDDWNLF